jgi:hypothetical protein
MTSFVKSAALTVALLAGATSLAYAQSENIAALPRGAQAVPSATPAPIGPTLSSDVPFVQQPRDVWGDLAKVQVPGPAAHWGPSPNSSLGSDSD